MSSPKKRWVFLALTCISVLAGVSASGADAAPGGGPEVSSPTNAFPHVVIHIPRPEHHFSIWRKLNPVWWLGNADEPVPPDWYRPGKSFRKLTWHLRNPCHNFDCYVIGISDKRFTVAGRFPSDTFNPNGGWNWTVCRYKCCRLPFLSYSRGRVRAYCGWRTGGAFGLELKLAAHVESPPAKPVEQPSPKADGR